MEKSYFTGPFAPLCETFVAQKRAAGAVYDTQARRLQQFDKLCKAHNIQDPIITKEIALEWYKQRPNEKLSSRRDRVQVLQQFSEFLCRQGYPSFLFPELPKGGENHEPYIFSKEELRRLFNRLDQLEPNNYTTGYMVFPVLFRTVYGCGLRISEALNLQKMDVDIADGLLHVRHGKNGRERILPVSGSLQQRLSSYMGLAHKETLLDAPFFYAKTFQPYSRSAVHSQFKGFLWDVGITYRGKDLGPRIHDLRHTMVCHNIRSWVEAGIPISSRLPILSKYLGHKSIASTQWYLRLTADLYPHIRDICERELAGFYASLPKLGSEDREDA